METLFYLFLFIFIISLITYFSNSLGSLIVGWPIDSEPWHKKLGGWGMVISVIVIIILLISGFRPDNMETESVQSDSQALLHEGGPEFDPVSLPALMEKEFDGRDLKLGQVLDDNIYYTRYFVTYKSGQLTISGILNIPKGSAPEGGFPVLFLNHGHIDTSVYTNGRGLRREQDYLARQGFAILHSDYRNHAQSDKDLNAEGDVRIGYIEDVINAVMAVKNSNIQSLSKTKFGMLGHSMGGGISQSVMVVKPDLVDAIVLYAPVSSDVIDSYNRWLSRNSKNLDQIKSRHGTPEDNPEFWENLSPRTFFSRVALPVMIFHGTADESCELAWSQTTRDLLLTAGKKVELVEYPGEAHEFGKAHTDFMQKSSQFFKSNLN